MYITFGENTDSDAAKNGNLPRGTIIILHNTLLSHVGKALSPETAELFTSYVPENMTTSLSEGDCGITGCIRVQYVYLHFN